MKKEIGFRVKQARLNANLTQEQLAEKANLSPSFISRLENGKVLPGLEKLNHLAQILNVGLEGLLCDSFSKTDASADPITNQICEYVDLMTLSEKQYLLSYIELFNQFMSKD